MITTCLRCANEAASAEHAVRRKGKARQGPFIKASGQWFTQHAPDRFDFEKDRARVCDQIATELATVDPDLTFEIGPREPARDLVIGAAGMKRAFPAVVALSTAAPRLTRRRSLPFVRGGR